MDKARIKNIVREVLKEIKVNDPKYPYFNKWKEEIIKHLQQSLKDNFDYGVNISKFKNISNPDDAIEYLISTEYLEDNDLDREHNYYFIENGEWGNFEEEEEDD